MRVLLVGEVRPEWCRGDLDPRDAGSAGAHLCTMLGLTPEVYLSTFDRVNLCRHEWNDYDAWLEALRIKAERRDKICLLGRKVQNAFNFIDIPFFTAIDRFILLPHPSGKCRIWNDARAVAQLRRLLLNEM